MADLNSVYTKCKALADAIIGRTDGLTAKSEGDFLFKVIVLFFFIKSWKTYQSVCLLCSHKFTEDASVLLRSLFEMTVALRYIAEDPERRARLFSEYDFVQKRLALDSVRDLPDPWPQKIVGDMPPEAIEEVEREDERVKPNYPDRTKWAGISLKKMASKVGAAANYGTIYGIFSSFAHTNPRAMLHYLEEGKTGIVFGIEPPEDYVKKSLIPAASSFLVIAEIKNRVFEHGLAAQIDGLLKELVEEPF